MLILTRKPGESIYIGDDIKVTIVELKGNQIRVGIDAPNDLRIYREEIYLQILEENKMAAETASDVASGLDSLASAWSKTKKKKGLGGEEEEEGDQKSFGILRPAALKPVSATGQSGQPPVVIRRKKGKDSDER